MESKQTKNCPLFGRHPKKVFPQKKSKKHLLLLLLLPFFSANKFMQIFIIPFLRDFCENCQLQRKQLFHAFFERAMSASPKFEIKEGGREGEGEGRGPI